MAHFEREKGSDMSGMHMCIWEFCFFFSSFLAFWLLKSQEGRGEEQHATCAQYKTYIYSPWKYMQATYKGNRGENLVPYSTRHEYGPGELSREGHGVTEYVHGTALHLTRAVSKHSRGPWYQIRW